MSATSWSDIPTSYFRTTPEPVPGFSVGVGLLYARRNRSRNASIRHTGLPGPGRSPGVHPHPEIRSSTRGSRATTVTGTSWPAFDPDTTPAGWGSPRKTTTVSRLPWVTRSETRALREYWIDLP